MCEQPAPVCSPHSPSRLRGKFLRGEFGISHPQLPHLPEQRRGLSAAVAARPCRSAAVTCRQCHLLSLPRPQGSGRARPAQPEVPVPSREDGPCPARAAAAVPVRCRRGHRPAPSTWQQVTAPAPGSQEGQASLLSHHNRQHQSIHSFTAEAVPQRGCCSRSGSFCS